MAQFSEIKLPDPYTTPGLELIVPIKTEYFEKPWNVTERLVFDKEENYYSPTKNAHECYSIITWKLKRIERQFWRPRFIGGVKEWCQCGDCRKFWTRKNKNPNEKTEFVWQRK